MKLISFILGALLVGLIAYLGYYTTTHSNFVIWFGVITALLAPLSFEFLLYPFRSKDKKLIKELSKVPQIENLIQEAKDSEAKVLLLEKQQKDLDKLISYESKRRTLLAERQIWILQAEESLKAIGKLDENIELLTSEKQNLPEHLKSLQENIKKIETEDISFTISGKNFTLKKKSFDSFPLYGKLLFEIIKLFERLFAKIENPK